MAALRLSAFTFCCVLLAGCVQSHRGRFSVVASRVPTVAFKTVYGARVQGWVCQGTRGWGKSVLEKAVADALAKEPGANALFLAKFWTETDSGCYVVEGTPVELR